ncbi:MAG: hypothetical protein V4543_06540 [Bacteroidota bacterium]
MEYEQEVKGSSLVASNKQLVIIALNAKVSSEKIAFDVHSAQTLKKLYSIPCNKNFASRAERDFIAFQPILKGDSVFHFAAYFNKKEACIQAIAMAYNGSGQVIIPETPVYRLPGDRETAEIKNVKTECGQITLRAVLMAGTVRIKYYAKISNDLKVINTFSSVGETAGINSYGILDELAYTPSGEMLAAYYPEKKSSTFQGELIYIGTEAGKRKVTKRFNLFEERIEAYNFSFYTGSQGNYMAGYYRSNLNQPIPGGIFLYRFDAAMQNPELVYTYAFTTDDMKQLRSFGDEIFAGSLVSIHPDTATGSVYLELHERMVQFYQTPLSKTIDPLTNYPTIESLRVHYGIATGQELCFREGNIVLLSASLAGDQKGATNFKYIFERAEVLKGTPEIETFTAGTVHKGRFFLSVTDKRANLRNLPGEEGKAKVRDKSSKMFPHVFSFRPDGYTDMKNAALPDEAENFQSVAMSADTGPGIFMMSDFDNRLTVMGGAAQKARYYFYLP